MIDSYMGIYAFFILIGVIIVYYIWAERESKGEERTIAIMELTVEELEEEE